MRNKAYRINEVILSFTKARKQRIAALFNAFCNAGKGQNNKFKCKVYFVSNPKYLMENKSFLNDFLTLSIYI